jgi:hypothetical protein
MKYRIHDLTDFSVREVNNWKEARGSAERSAIRQAMRMNDVIRIGKIIVEPVKEKR